MIFMIPYNATKKLFLDFKFDFYTTPGFKYENNLNF